MNHFKKYVFQFPVDLPGAKFCVVVAEVPDSDVDIYENNAPKRKYWKIKKLFKLKVNADKYMGRIYHQQRNHNLTMRLVSKGIFNLN